MNHLSQLYWNEFWKGKQQPLSVSAWKFGSYPDEHAQLVVDGKKTATCSAQIFYELENEPLPTTGDYSIILNRNGQPIAIIKTVEVSLIPMNEVTEEFAKAEGEGSYEDWKSEHVKFFTSELQKFGLIFSEDMLLVCERFTLLDVKDEKGMLTTTLKNYLDDKISLLSYESRQEMLLNIGNLDGHLRDKLVYQSFVKLIFSNQLNPNEIQSLLETVTGDSYLFHQIGESGTDSVFTRSFSVLVIAAIIEYDVQNKIVSSAIIQHTANQVIRYMLEERDTRGFIPQKGWAHAIAHGADALDALAKHPLIQKENIAQILCAIKHSLFLQVDYLDEEEERLAIIIASLLEYQNVEVEVQLWFKELTEMVRNRLDENKGSIDAYTIPKEQ